MLMYGRSAKLSEPLFSNVTKSKEESQSENSTTGLNTIEIQCDFRFHTGINLY